MRSLTIAFATVLLLMYQPTTEAQPQPQQPSLPEEESRHNYVPYPASANAILQAEVDDIGSPLGLAVVTSLTTTEDYANSLELWNNLKGMAHRLHKQNQILHINPHYYLDSGYDLGCRQIQRNEDTGAEEDVEVLPVPPQCENACTNHGRYCAVQEDNNNNSSDARGVMMVEETLRRVCFVKLYQGSDLKFWDYREAFDELGCYGSATAEAMTACVQNALAKVPNVDAAALTNCMHLAGGLEDDVVNIRLKEQMDKQTKGVHAFTRQDVPFVRVGSQRYQGSDALTTPALFQSVCSVFERERQVTPVACEFCSNCQGVRQCLWFLDCDGTVFDGPVAGTPTTPADTSGASESNTNELPPASSTLTPTEMVFTVAPTTTMPPNGLPSEETAPSIDQDMDNNGYSTNTIDSIGDKNAEKKQQVKNEVLALFCVLAILCLYLPIVKCYKKRQANRKSNSAEAYFDEMMHASYGDNMAVSGRIDDDASDRRFEFEPEDNIRQRSAPPSTSFNVHVVKV